MTMVLPQFTLRMALGLMAVLGFVSLVISRGLQGSSWAMGVSIALAALVFAFAAYAAVFGLVFAVSKVFNRQSVPPGPGSSRAAALNSMQVAQPRDNSSLVPPPASESL
jgi:hypothetical protein